MYYFWPAGIGDKRDISSVIAMTASMSPIGFDFFQKDY